MTIIVVGGHARKVGKTSVVTGLISAFRNYSWTAIKISMHQAGDSHGSDPFMIYEESSYDGKSDSSRYLLAGAARAYWVQVRQDKIEEFLPKLFSILQSSAYSIIESNSIVQYLRPDLYVMVVKYGVENFKKSAKKTIDRADAIVAIDWNSSLPGWKGAEVLSTKPLFQTTDPKMIPSGLLDLVKSRLT